MGSPPAEFVIFDAGLFIAALLADDPRHGEAKPLVDAARRGALAVCTTCGILSEVYAALTWEKAQPPHQPAEAARAVRLLVQPPSAIEILPDGLDVALLTLDLAAKHGLKARRVHDARHAATALSAGVRRVYTFDLADWEAFRPDAIEVVGPPSVLLRP